MTTVSVGVPLNGSVVSGAVIWDGANWVNSLISDASISDVSNAKVTGLSALLAAKISAVDGAWSRAQQEKYRGLTVSESMPFWAPRDTETPVAGTAYFVLMPVSTGQVINDIVMASVGAATMGTGPHWWGGVYNVGLTTQLAFSGDLTSTVISPAALVQIPMTAPYTVPSNVTAVYGCFMFNTGTGGVQPTFRGVNAGLAALNGSSTLGSGTTALGTSGLALGASPPATPITLTAVANSYYMGFR